MSTYESDAQSRESAPAIVMILAIMTIMWGAVTLLGAFLPSGSLIPGMDEGAPEAAAWVDISVLVLGVVKIVAAILLIRMAKIGFYLYTGAEILTAMLNLVYGISLYQWAEESSSATDSVDPTLLVIILMGVQMALSMVWVGGFAAHLGKMR